MNQYNYSDYDPDRDNNRHDAAQRTASPRAAAPRRAKADSRERKSTATSHAETTPSVFDKIVNFITSPRTKIIMGIFLILLCVWLSVAALSFLKSNKVDQSAVVSPTIENVAPGASEIENIAGPGGASVSHHLFVEGFGFGSVVIIAYLVIVALSLLGVKNIHFWKLTFKSLILAITVSMVLGLLSVNSTAAIPPGGYHGHYINVLLISNFGWIGAMLVSVLLVSIVVTIYINELASIYTRYKRKMRTLRDRRIMEDDRRNYVEETVSEALSDTPLDDNANEDSTVDNNDNETSSTARERIDIELEDLPEVTEEEEINIDMADEIERRGAIADSAANGNNSGSTSGSSYGSESYSTAASGATVPHGSSTDSATVGYTTPDTSSVRAAGAATTSESTTRALPGATTGVAGQAAATVNGSTGNTEGSGNSEDPGFEITHEKEIEQGSGLPSRLAAEGPYDPRADLSGYRMPPISLMVDRPGKPNSVDLTEQEGNKERITKTLEQYNIRIDKIKATVGPTVTLYEIVPAEGVRIAAIKRLEDDIALSLSARGIRIIAPIPGRGTIGIEVPNLDPQTVSIRSILGSRAFQESKCELPMALGATISNDVYIADLAKMPHLLVAGATGQGKSVGLNTIIASLLYKKHPSELKFVLVDPKMVEFSLYACLEKHYLAKLPDEEEPVVTDPNKVVDTLNSLCREMDDRYSLLKDAGCRSIIEYNTKFINRRLNPENGHRYMPYIVMIVDEFADLIMMAGKNVETPIARIAQKARAVGMHMIIATQRPSTNVITGLIKANFPARIGFKVSQMVDSRTILDSPGANQLIGRGDMLISNNGSMERVQCAFIDTPEVEALCNHIRDQIGYPTAYILPDPPQEGGDDSGSSSSSVAERDPLLEEVGRWIVQGNTASTSSVQRRYSIGYNRAGKIMDQLESLGVVDRAQGGKPRRVLVDPMTLEDIFSTFSQL